MAFSNAGVWEGLLGVVAEGSEAQWPEWRDAAAMCDSIRIARPQIASDANPKNPSKREKTPTPKTRFSIWTLLRTPDRFTTRPLPVHFTTKMSVVRPFSVHSKAEIGPY